MNNPSLKITDGTAEGTVDMLALYGWLLKEWKPAIPDIKGGGIFRDSPLINGRRLAYRRFDNIIDTFNLVGSDDSQDLMITSIQKLQRLLEKATAYWTADWQNEPVWLEARAAKETNTRYATVIDYRLTGFGGPFEQPFFSGCSSATEAILVIEHMLWQETIPGQDGTCVELYNKTDYLAVADYASDIYYPTSTLHDVNYEPTKPLNTNSGELYIGYKGGGGADWQAGVVFDAVDIPAGATLIKATLGVTEYPILAANALDLIVEGQSQGWGRINSVTITNGGTGYHAPIVAVYDYTARGAGGAKLQAIQVNGVITEINIIDGGRGYTNPVIVIADMALHGGKGATATCTASSMNLDAAVFDGTKADYVERERTDANVKINIVINQAFPTTIDVTQIINEIITNANWTTGDNICLFFVPTSAGGARGIYSFDHGSNYPSLTLEWTTEVAPLGRTTTCAAEVYVSNKHNTAPINYIYCWDADGAVKFSPNMYGWVYTDEMPLFQDNTGTVITPEVGDRIYFGSCPIDANDFNYGPFNNIIFDLYSIGVGITGVWKYYDSGVGDFHEFDTDGDAYNELCGDQSNFQNLGVGSVIFEQQETFSTSAINGKTGYWVCFEVTAVDTPTSPYQWHRDIYTALNPYIDIDAEEVPGDIPALARVVTEAAGCSFKTLNTIVMGLRSLSRGENFSAYLNCSSYQNPAGVAFALADYGAGSPTLEAGGESPTGQRLELSAVSSDTDFKNICNWTITGAIAKEYIGVYHAYVRCISTVSQIKMRLRAVFGEEHNTYYSDISNIPLTGYVVAVDLGQLSIQPVSSIKPSEIIDKVSIYLDTYTDVDAYYDIFYIYDIVLVPADEWSGNFGMPKITGTAVLQYGFGLDIDGITTPRGFRAIQTKGTSRPPFTPKRFAADWSKIASGEPIFQANSDQRLWFMQYKHQNGLVTYFENLQAVRAERSARYLLARGNV